MRIIVCCILIICLALALAVLPAGAQSVTAEDARSVAQNWVALTIRQQGDWGGSPSAQIGGIREFRQGDRLIGYYCPVSPQGFLVMSLRRELAPVKAYSDTTNLDPDAEGGLTDLIKLQMAAALDAIEQEAGPVVSVSSAQVTPLMEFNYLGAWDVLDTEGSASLGRIQEVSAASNYQQGGVMLSVSWHQGEPYNNQVPAPPTGSTCPAPRCAVGCVATAGAQLMAYWDWPPYGIGTPYSDPYDWPNMARRYVWDAGQSRWEDENGNLLTQAQLNAVSELSQEVGQAVGMVYCSKGCESSASTYNMEGVYENNYRYSTSCNKQNRNAYTAISWFNLLKDQFNLNRPVHYRVDNHSIVSDGWRERIVGGNLVREYHMNYGWDDNNNAWYTLDALPLGGLNVEYILRDIVPAQALGNSLSGTYTLQSFPYRYFDRDTAGNSATFSAGQYLQFLPGVKATCNSGTGTEIRFDGTSSSNTRLFTRGDTSKGAVIRSGTIKLKPGGSVKLP